MTILEKVKEYTNRHGMVDNYGGDNVSQNALLFTGEMYIILNQLGLLDVVDIKLMRANIDKHKADVGLYHRAPDNFELNAQDDLIGLTALAKEVGWDDITREVIERAETQTRLFSIFGIYNVFNNTNPGQWLPAAWLGRFPFVIAHFYYAAKRRPTLLLRLAFILNLLASLFKTPKPNHHDYWTLTWLMAYTAKGQGFFVDLAIKVFAKQVEKHGGMGHIVGEFFANKEHPIAQTWGSVKL